MAGQTLLQLRESAKSRADLQNSSFIIDAEWDYFVNESAAELHDLILKSDPKSVITKEIITTTIGQEFYPLPKDFYKLEAIFRLVGNVRYGIDRVDFHGIGQGSAVLSAVVVGGSPYQYALVGSELYFLPTPSGSTQVELWYFPAFTYLVADTDTLNYPVVNGWEQFVIVATVVKAKMKEGMDPSFYLASKAELGARIVEMANKRDEWEPPSFYDAYGATSRSRRYNSYNPYMNLPFRWYK